MCRELDNCGFLPCNPQVIVGCVREDCWANSLIYYRGLLPCYHGYFRCKTQYLRDMHFGCRLSWISLLLVASQLKRVIVSVVLIDSSLQPIAMQYFGQFKFNKMWLEWTKWMGLSRSNVDHFLSIDAYQRESICSRIAALLAQFATLWFDLMGSWASTWFCHWYGNQGIRVDEMCGWSNIARSNFLIFGYIFTIFQ